MDEQLKKSEKTLLKEFTKGIIKENPNLVILLGLCPTLAVTTSVANGLGMGIAATIVLICSNIFISLLKNYIPDEVRIPSYIVVIASFVTIVEMLMKAYVPFLAKTLGIFVPLIVVNCIILGRAEAFANKRSVSESIMDAIGMGLGFTLSLLLISLIREIFGYCWIDFTGYGAKEVFTLPFVNKETSEVVLEIFGNKYEVFKGIFILAMAPGAFFVIALILALINFIKDKTEKRSIQ